MNIETLTIAEAREIAALFNLNKVATVKRSHPFEIGANYFIRTVTHHYTGHLVAVHDSELVLTRAAWIADDGRLTDALKTETFNEVEIYPVDREVIIGRGSILDAVQLKTLPVSQK